MAPQWNEEFKFENIPITAQITAEVKDWNRLEKNELIGTATIDLAAQQAASKAAPGVNWRTDDWYLISDKYPTAAVRLRMTFHFLSGQEAEDAVVILRKQIKEAKGSVKEGELGVYKTSIYQLRAHIYRARHLEAADESGLADPYAVIQLCGKTIEVPRIEKTLNPSWFASYAVNVEVPSNIALAPPLNVQLYDWDQLTSDDPIGSLRVNLADITLDRPSDVLTLAPQWYTLSNFDGKKMEGAELLAHFQLVDARHANTPLPKSLVPHTLPKLIEVYVLGLRNLSNLFGIHKTYIQFELPNGKHFATRKSARPSSRNPNFLQVIRIPFNMPSEAMFAPSIDITVKDTLFGGLIQRVIGTATLDLDRVLEKGDLLEQQMDELKTMREYEDVETPSLQEEEKKSQVRAVIDDGKGLEPSISVVDNDEEDVSVPLLRGDNEGDKMSEHVIDIDGEEKKGDIPDGGLRGESITLDDAGEYEAADIAEEPEWMKGRNQYDDELEDVMTLNPFDTIKLYTGRKNAGVFGTEYRTTGQLKVCVYLCMIFIPVSIVLSCCFCWFVLSIVLVCGYDTHTRGGGIETRMG